jgi:hypothetical protein
MNTDIISIVIIIFILVICYRLYYNSDLFQLKCIISNIDGEQYCVRERNKLDLAANLLANVNKNLTGVIKYCDEHYSKKECVIRMKKDYNPKKIMETLPTSKYTAYSQNKGEKLAFCLNARKDNQEQLIDLNTLTFVALHELAHVATKSVGHTPEFWDNFKFLLIQAEKINIYNPIDYKKNPKNYCGMTITDNPYFN